MGFTPLEGLIMGTRSGDLDAGAVLHMARQGRSWQEIDGELNRESGLLGLSGVSDDVRELLALEDAGHAGAALALTAYCHRIRKYVGAYTAVLGGLDALVFGGGIGENAPRIRARICAGFEWLGLKLDDEANARCIGCEGRISKAESAIDVRVIPVREEEVIARAALTCVG
jgi:acetate kinase